MGHAARIARSISPALGVKAILLHNQGGKGWSTSLCILAGLFVYFLHKYSVRAERPAVMGDIDSFFTLDTTRKRTVAVEKAAPAAQVSYVTKSFGGMAQTAGARTRAAAIEPIDDNNCDDVVPMDVD